MNYGKLFQENHNPKYCKPYNMPELFILLFHCVKIPSYLFFLNTGRWCDTLIKLVFTDFFISGHTSIQRHQRSV